MDIREWQLITGAEEGGGERWEAAGATEVLPLQKGGGKTFSHAEGWAHKVLR